MIDWTLLSRTAMLLGSYWSSFSEEAALVHQIPRVQMRVDGNILGFDVSQPNCRFPWDLEPGEVFTLNLCEAFSAAWGIRPVYC